MKTLSGLLGYLVLNLVALSAIADTGEWVLQASSKEPKIDVYTRSVSHSDLKEFKGVTNIRAPISSFVALLKDREVATQWMKDVAYYEVIEEPSEVEALVYMVNAAPWPVVNRDSVIRTKISATLAGSVLVTLTGEPSSKPLSDKYIRVPKLSGFWKFEPQSSGIVKVTYQVHVDPGGSLPDWLVNSIVIDTPLETLGNMHDRIFEEKYKNKTFLFLVDDKSSSPISSVQ